MYSSRYLWIRFLQQQSLPVEKFAKGDQIVSLNNIPTPYYHDFFRCEKKTLKNKEVPVQVMRGADTIAVRVKWMKKVSWDFFYKSPAAMFGTVTKTYSMGEAIPEGIKKMFSNFGKVYYRFKANIFRQSKCEWFAWQRNKHW